TRSFKNVPPGAIRSGRRYGKRAGVFENDRTDHARHLLQANLRFGAGYIGTRLVREVRRTDAAAYAERLSGHERVNSVEAPAANDMVQRRMNRRRESFLLPNREFPQGIHGEHMTAIEVRAASLLTPVAYVGGRPGIRCAQGAAGSRSDRIHGLIIDCFSKRVRQPGLQPVAEALSQCSLGAVIVGISS